MRAAVWPRNEDYTENQVDTYVLYVYMLDNSMVSYAVKEHGWSLSEVGQQLWATHTTTSRDPNVTFCDKPSFCVQPFANRLTSQPVRNK
jgi:hypothetical protein